jgi:hypothetical protein
MMHDLHHVKTRNYMVYAAYVTRYILVSDSWDTMVWYGMGWDEKVDGMENKEEYH